MKPILVAMTCLCVAFAAHAQAPQPLAQRTPIKFGIGGRVEINSAALLAKEFGEFERENLDVEISVQKPSDGLVLLSTGRTDVLAACRT